MTQKKDPKQPLSPAEYIRTNGRTLPIDACYINHHWRQQGLANITVIRQHPSGNYTLGMYLVDLLCMGMRNAKILFNLYPEQLAPLIDLLPDCTKIGYHEAHSIIYGAIAYARKEVGVEPHSGFELAQYLLEEDSDKIPLISYEFGKDEKPFLRARDKLEASKYLPKLRKRYGKDIPYSIDEDDYEDYDDEDDEEYDENGEPWDAFTELLRQENDRESELLSEAKKQKMQEAADELQREYEAVQALTHTTYAYVHAPYPTTLVLVHSELEALYKKKYYFRLPRRVIQEILALPRESLLADLERITYYQLGKSDGDNITPGMYDSETNTLTHVLFLLGELRASENLQSVLEILRQDYPNADYHFCETREEVLCPTLYCIVRNQLDKLMDFMKEPHLDSYLRSDASHAATFVAMNEPERRDEIVEWFKQLLRFFITNISDSTVYDATLAGTIMLDLIELHATELLPEIKELCDIGQIDLTCCGQYEEIEDEMLQTQRPLGDYEVLNIYQRYKYYEELWKD